MSLPATVSPWAVEPTTASRRVRPAVTDAGGAASFDGMLTRPTVPGCAEPAIRGRRFLRRRADPRRWTGNHKPASQAGPTTGEYSDNQ